MKVATATYELTDAQENLRMAQEIINRDLMYAGRRAEEHLDHSSPAGFCHKLYNTQPGRYFTRNSKPGDHHHGQQRSRRHSGSGHRAGSDRPHQH